MVSRTISVEEAGRLIGVSRGSAYEAARTGTLAQPARRQASCYSSCASGRAAGRNAREPGVCT